MKKTKIICSMGPSSYTKDMMRKMINNGMNVARINFSHATLEERAKTEELVRYFNDVNNKEDGGHNIAILFDTKGPDLRTGNFENDLITLEDGKEIRIAKEEVLGTAEEISLNYSNVINNINVGNDILLDDGLIRLTVIDKDSKGLTCKIINGGTIKSRRGVNVPGVSLDMPFVSKEDEEDIKYACEHDGDYLGISFVTSAADVKEARKLLKKYGREDMPIISKVETAKAIENLDEIIDESDAIMVARGDLGVEVPMEMLPIYQKLMIQKCREKGKICIVATEMLASMYTSARPTRAEVSDIANAVLDGCDAVMLSGETTIGKYPDMAVKYMADICENAEKYYDYDYKFDSERENDITESIARSVVESAKTLDVKAVVAATMSGYTAQRISNLKPLCPIIAAAKDQKVAKRLALNYGVYSTVIGEYDLLEDIISAAEEKAGDLIELSSGDTVIITGGFPKNGQKLTNFMRIDKIK